MASKVITRIQEAAEKLSELRTIIADKEENNKKELEALKAERDAVQGVLISDMNKQGLLSLKVKSGDTFAKSVRKGLEIVNEPQAFKWAYENRAVSINKTIVAQLLKEAKELPIGFKAVETEFISVRKAKTND